MFMTEPEQNKICPHCAETIRSAAKVCPHCRHWQRRWSLQNPAVGMTLWCLVSIAILTLLGTFYEKAFGPKQEFAAYRDEISIVSSQFSQRNSGSNLLVTVVGTITNHSVIGWKDVGVEAQFFDKAGNLIDALTVNANDYHGVVILPHGETAFKIEGRASRPANDYETNRLSVRWAKDADAWLP